MTGICLQPTPPGVIMAPDSASRGRGGIYLHPDDALGRRIETRDYADDSDPCDMGDTMVTTRHAYAGLNTIEEYVWCDIDQDEATEPTEWFVAREFLWGDRFPEPLMMVDYTDAGDVAAGTEEVLHYVRDALGSVVGLVDAGDPDATPEPVPAKLVERYDYDPYGKTYVEFWDATGGTGGEGAWIRTADAASHFGNPFMWTSQRYDQTVGLYHFPFRSYSPELGRWMQRDPLGYVDGVSLYQYVGCHPTILGDPLGLQSRDGFTGGAADAILEADLMQMRKLGALQDIQHGAAIAQEGLETATTLIIFGATVAIPGPEDAFFAFLGSKGLRFVGDKIVDFAGRVLTRTEVDDLIGVYRAHRATQLADELLDGMLKDATLERVTKRKTQIWILPWDVTKAFKWFEEFAKSVGQEIVELMRGRVWVVRLEDGRTVIFRNISGDKRPTIELQRGSRTTRKVRIDGEGCPDVDEIR